MEWDSNKKTFDNHQFSHLFLVDMWLLKKSRFASMFVGDREKRNSALVFVKKQHQKLPQEELCWTQNYQVTGHVSVTKDNIHFQRHDADFPTAAGFNQPQQE